MKTFILVLCCMISNLLFAQGLILSNLDEKPKTLMLEKIHPWSGESYLAHVKEEPLTFVNVVFLGSTLNNLQAELLKNKSSRIYCDGEYSLANDFHGSQFIALKSISVCIDDEGWPVAVNVGQNLTPIEVQDKIRELSKNIKPKVSGGVYQGDGYKEVDEKDSLRKEARVEEK